jgi:hypothetical protein
MFPPSLRTRDRDVDPAGRPSKVARIPHVGYGPFFSDLRMPYDCNLQLGDVLKLEQRLLLRLVCYIHLDASLVTIHQCFVLKPERNLRKMEW